MSYENYNRRIGIVLTGLGLLASAGSYILRTHSEEWFRASNDDQKIQFGSIYKAYDDIADD